MTTAVSDPEVDTVTEPEVPEEQRALAQRMREFRSRYKVLAAGMEKMEAQRAALYVEGRKLDPPMTFREMADIFGITQAAVMQSVDRVLNPGRKKKPKRAKKA